MEFTYEGLVRQGFGFFNPNHAAALFALLLPGVWLLRKWLCLCLARTGSPAARFTGGAAITGVLLLEWALYLGIVLTFSRAGLLTLALCALLWWRLSRTESVSALRWLRRSAGIALVIVAALLAGAFARFSPTKAANDRAVSNRFAVWQGGLALLADTPGGVGAGYSGKVYTLFYNPQQSTAYRTLVNSFLTAAVEHGIFDAGIIAGILAAAAFGMYQYLRRCRNDRNTAGVLFAAGILTALAAIILSGTLSTCFDLNMLTARRGSFYGTTNDILQAGLCALALMVSIGAAVFGLFRARRRLPVIIASVLLGALATAILWGAGLLCRNNDTDSPGARVFSDAGGVTWAVSPAKSLGGAVLLVPESGAQGRELLTFAREEFPDRAVALPLSGLTRCPQIPQAHEIVAVVLCGRNSEYAPQFPGREVVLYKPEIFREFPEEVRVTGIYLERWRDSPRAERWKTRYPALIRYTH